MKNLSFKIYLVIGALLGSFGGVSASDLPPCPSSGYKHNCFGVSYFASGSMYEGEFQNNRHHGQGTYTLSDGSVYVGEFKDDLFNGRGTLNFENGNKYIGEFSDDRFNGEGTYTFADGKIFAGTFEDGVLQKPKKSGLRIIEAPIFRRNEIISASSGSGFAVSKNGYIITNNHVIEGCKKVAAHIQQIKIPLSVVSSDTKSDVALLKGNFRPTTVIPISDNLPELLQDIYVAGYPFGDKISTSVKVTKGIVSSLTGIGNNYSNIQIDAALQSGNSGGPILDEKGNVVGVAVSKLDAKYMFDKYGSIPENTNFGVKSIIVRNIMNENNVDGPSANKSEISKSKLGKMISSGTYYISCWMTMAQIEKMKTKKVFFSNLD
mgnify:CR=1 FL=1